MEIEIESAFTPEELELIEALGPVGRFSKKKTARCLGVEPHDIPVLIRAGLLLPLGSSAPYTVQYFAGVDIVEKAKNKVWLAKATRAIQEHWQNRKR